MAFVSFFQLFDGFFCLFCRVFLLVFLYFTAFLCCQYKIRVFGSFCLTAKKGMAQFAYALI